MDYKTQSTITANLDPEQYLELEAGKKQLWIAILLNFIPAMGYFYYRRKLVGFAVLCLTLGTIAAGPIPTVLMYMVSMYGLKDVDTVYHERLVTSIMQNAVARKAAEA